MCIKNNKHLYIFEPLQTFSDQLVVPVFIYTFNSQMFSKCIKPRIKQLSQSSIQIFIPSNISYNSPDLCIIPISQFKNEYPSLLKPHFWQNLDHGFGLQLLQLVSCIAYAKFQVFIHCVCKFSGLDRAQLCFCIRRGSPEATPFVHKQQIMGAAWEKKSG
jgi:hypothetical protein